MFLDSNKRYVVTIRLGVSTDTGDSDGEVLETHPVNVSLADLEKALESFRGDILQVPPMYSALKKDGVPLYKLARKGVEIERAPREVKVESLDILNFDVDRVDIDIQCSKGFYVRSLAMDLGKLLGTGGMVESLRRTEVGKFSVEQSITIEQLEALEAINHRLREQNLTLNLSEVKGPVMDALQQSDFLQHLSGKIYLTQHQAVKDLKPDEIEPYII